MEKTLTAPLAIIKIGGKAVGKLKSVRLTENIQRGDVKGIGEVTTQEVPVLGIKCTFSASSYFISLNKLGDSENTFLYRNAGSLKKMLDTLLLSEAGVDIYLYRKLPKTIDPVTKIVTETKEGLIGVVRNAFIDSQNMSIDEGQVSGTDISGTYLEPIIP